MTLLHPIGWREDVAASSKAAPLKSRPRFLGAVYSTFFHDSQNIGTFFTVAMYASPESRMGIDVWAVLELGLLNEWYLLNHACVLKKVLITRTHCFMLLMLPAYSGSEESEGGGRRPSRLSIELIVHAGN